MPENMIAAELPKFPEVRPAACPFAPPAGQREAGKRAAMSRVLNSDSCRSGPMSGRELAGR